MSGASEMERVVAALKTLAVQPWPEGARLILRWNEVAKTLPGIGYEAFFHAHRLASRNIYNGAGLDLSVIERLRERGFAVVVDDGPEDAALPDVKIEVGLAWLDLSKKKPGRASRVGMYVLPEDDSHG
ncbi:hypothetical protein SAMN05216567_108103 [Variovorax sp. OK605]|jgi:hypothetical protein|uniref:hypothetical protein n=1 Tax=unclassified Variovorax TaxID=663243 RepID=UPI0008CE8AA2|nr:MULTISPECIES: hypothetical protein [unclassified Variovorax]SEK01774.1 hypothetical protein SAMN05518853_10698 [Variovorax sp. OK202]SFD32226.1 hypothetical protein SAMN05444746_10698 [Variovorax sp. OK212]SFP71290.1 hypothetical protein SAMN05216567_108103 [Variovorax sp. OK605]